MQYQLHSGQPGDRQDPTWHRTSAALRRTAVLSKNGSHTPSHSALSTHGQPARGLSILPEDRDLQGGRQVSSFTRGRAAGNHYQIRRPYMASGAGSLCCQGFRHTRVFLHCDTIAHCFTYAYPFRSGRIVSLAFSV